MSARRANTLVRGLGNETAVFRHANPDAAMWSLKHELLATIAELVDHTNRTLASIHGGGKEPPRPIKITRPGKRKKRPGTTMGELGTMFSPRPKE